ncbi:MAG: glycosyltransferase family 2 protein [bacterium]|nr:glycosyltransferase family 2 protein [bacterium]
MVYVVILNWNGIEDTKECIESLFGENVRIVVVDNGSENDEGVRLKQFFPYIHLIQNTKNEGFAGGCNVGISYCLGCEDCEHIMLLNNDAVVKDGFLKPLLDYLDSHPKSVVSPKILYYDEPEKVQVMGAKLFIGGTRSINRGKKSDDCVSIIEPDCISGACLIAWKKSFEEVGLFDPQYFAYLEDLDWSVRARAKGYKLAIIPGSKIFHKHSKSTQGSYVKSYLIMRNSIYFSRKHYSGLKKHIFISNSVWIGFLLNLYRHKGFRFAGNYFKGLKDGLSGKMGKF